MPNSESDLASQTRDLLPGISVFLPSHNEEANVDRVVRGILSVLPAVARDYEVIVVDDGSRDRTAAVAEQIATSDPHVRVVRHEKNRGYGGAVISGIRAARQPYVVLCDGDGQFDPADIAKLAAHARDFEIVVGRRIDRADALVRRMNGEAWTLFMRLLFGIRIHDVDCGLKLFRRSTLDKMELRAQGAMISTELLARAAKSGAKIHEVPVRHLPRVAGEQSGAKLKVIARAFGELFKLYRELRTR
jgi:glycosyltransferase involved in cell wall biosynthesis